MKQCWISYIKIKPLFKQNLQNQVVARYGTSVRPYSHLKTWSLSLENRFNAPTWQLHLQREDIIVFTVNCADFFENITNFGNLIVSLRRLQCKSEQPNQTDILVTANFFSRQILCAKFENYCSTNDLTSYSVYDWCVMWHIAIVTVVAQFSALIRL